ncbi:MAG: uroporphyrinogen decarboxylase family protein [Armatimonadota bacterium]
MTRKERVLAAASGKPVDRAPFSLWYHFRLEDPSGESLATAEIAFFRRFQPDFLKVMHDIPYELPAGMTKIESPSDWSKLEVLPPTSGNFGRQLEALSSILEQLGEDPPPVIDTVFNVFATAQKLCGQRTLEHLRAEPEPVLQGLATIAESLAGFAGACMNIGLAGIFLAVSGANTDLMSENEYARVFLPLDRRVLDGTGNRAVFNVVHIHGANIMLELVSKLPCHALSWSDRASGPSLGEGRKWFSGGVIGGINEQTVANQTPADVAADVRDALNQTSGRSLLVGPGCAVPTPQSESELAEWDARLAAVRRELESFSYLW